MEVVDRIKNVDIQEMDIDALVQLQKDAGIVDPETGQPFPDDLYRETAELAKILNTPIREFIRAKTPDENIRKALEQREPESLLQEEEKEPLKKTGHELLYTPSERILENDPRKAWRLEEL